jgi:hypothetical protein
VLAEGLNLTSAGPPPLRPLDSGSSNEMIRSCGRRLRSHSRPGKVTPLTAPVASSGHQHSEPKRLGARTLAQAPCA